MSDQAVQASISTNDKAIQQLNSLLRGVISATETYRIAIDKSVGKDTTENTSLLQKFQQEHAAAAGYLRERIRELGGEASDSSGAWGAWAKTVQGAANIFGTVSSLRALREGEDHGLKDYESALSVVDSASRQLIESELIPAQQRHLASLDQLISAFKTAQ